MNSAERLQLVFWQPAQFGVEYQPQANSIVLLQVDDVPTARAEEIDVAGFVRLANTL